MVALSCCAGVVWGDEEKVGAGEQQCSAGEHHCDCDYTLPPPVSHGSWTTLILEQRFKMSPPARKVVISLGKVKWSESVVFFWFC